MNRRHAIATLLCSALLAVSCAEEPVEPEVDLDAVFYSTVVNFDDAGIPRVTQYTLTRRQQIAELAEIDARFAREQREGIGSTKQALLTESLSCVSSNLIMYDKLNYVGDQLCLTGFGQGDLRAYVRIPGVSNWAGSVRSFRAGGYPGYFGESGTASYSSFEAYQQSSSANPRVRAARYVTRLSAPPTTIDMAQ